MPDDKHAPPPADIRAFFLASGRPLEAPATLGDVVHAFEVTSANLIPDPATAGVGDSTIAGVNGTASAAAAPVMAIINPSSTVVQPSDDAAANLRADVEQLAVGFARALFEKIAQHP